MAHRPLALRALLRLVLAVLLTALPACGTTPRAPSPSLRPSAQAGGGEVFEVAAGKPFRWKGRAGAMLELENVNGSIDASTTTEPDVEIVAEMRDDAEGTAAVVLTQAASGLSVCVRAETMTAPSCERGHGRHGHTAAVHVTVRVPAGLHLVARTVNGRVHVRGLVGRVEANAVNGQVLLEDVRDVRASSVNGQVRASFANGAFAGPIELSTVNGAVSVELPAGTDADLRADTVRGRVAIDLPGVADLRGPHVRLALGHGGHELSLRTVHGSIHVEERR
jgi:DUF4097 and DUF4098 domain-containing protein YvlB